MEQTADWPRVERQKNTDWLRVERQTTEAIVHRHTDHLLADS